MKKYRIDEEAKQINLFSERWYHLEEENADLPSVTTYLESYPKGDGFNKWLMNTKDPYQRRDEAAQLGSYVHGLVERTLLGDKIKYEEHVTPIEVWERYLYWCKFWKALITDPTKTLKSKKVIKEIVVPKDFTEFITFDLEESYAGTVDKLIKIVYEDDSVTYVIVDWKTGEHIYESAKLQIAAYAKSVGKQFKMPIGLAIIVQLNPEVNQNGYRVNVRTKEEIDNDFQDFLAVKQIWLREHGNQKPKYKSYPTEVDLEFIKNNEIIKGA